MGDYKAIGNTGLAARACVNHARMLNEEHKNNESSKDCYYQKELDNRPIIIQNITISNPSNNISDISNLCNSLAKLCDVITNDISNKKHNE